MRTLLLVRHGQATHHVERRIGGSYDSELTALGRNQAAKVADRLAADYKIDRLYTSTLTRATQTADAIAAATQVPAIPDARLRESDTGLVAGLTYEEARRIQPKPPEGWTLYTAAPEGESPLDVFRRVAEFYLRLRDDTRKQLPNGAVAIVAHGGTIRDLINLVLGLPVHTTLTFAVAETSLCEFTFDGAATTVVRLNDTAHLR